MWKFIITTLAALSALSATSAWAGCPSGYGPCGETKQLCCPL